MGEDGGTCLDSFFRIFLMARMFRLTKLSSDVTSPASGMQVLPNALVTAEVLHGHNTQNMPTMCCVRMK